LDSVPSPLTSLPSLYLGIPPKGRCHRSSTRAGVELALTKPSVGNPPASWSWPRQEYPSLHSILYNLPAVPEVPPVSPRSTSVARPRPRRCFTVEVKMDCMRPRLASRVGDWAPIRASPCWFCPDPA
jgi:hypothetical protein